MLRQDVPASRIASQEQDCGKFTSIVLRIPRHHIHRSRRHIWVVGFLVWRKDLRYGRGLDNHLEAVVLSYRMDHDRRVLAAEAVVHTHRLTVRVVMAGSFFHSLGRSHRIVLFLVSVHADSPLEDNLVEHDLYGRKGRPILVVRSEVAGSEIDSLHHAVDVLPEYQQRSGRWHP